MWGDRNLLIAVPDLSTSIESNEKTEDELPTTKKKAWYLVKWRKRLKKISFFYN